MSEWQPISTAPKDEEFIVGRMGVVVCTMGWDDEDARWFTFNQIWEHHAQKYKSAPWTPSHWMPLPQPPEQDGKGMKKGYLVFDAWWPSRLGQVTAVLPNRIVVKWNDGAQWRYDREHSKFLKRAAQEAQIEVKATLSKIKGAA